MTKVLTKKEFEKLSEDDQQLYGCLEHILKAKRNIEDNIIDLGWHLVLAKGLVAYGEWENWLYDNVDFSVRTAQKYMKVADQYYDLREIEPFNSLNKSQLVALLDVKKDDREDFVNNTHDVDGAEKTIQDMSIRELKEVIKNEKKIKKKTKEIRNEHVDASETEKVIDVDLKESHENKTTLTEEQKLAQLIKDQQELEQQLKLKQRQAKETKESILKNKKSLDLKVEFEEVMIKSTLGSDILHYKISLIRGNSKETVLEKVGYFSFEKFDITDDHDDIVFWLNHNQNLIEEERNYILGECLKFKDTAIKRGEETYKAFDDDFYENLQDKINKELNIRKHLPQENQDLKKEFIIAGYKALAKKYHPDTNQGSAEAEDKFKAIGILKDTLLQQNLLN